MARYRPEPPHAHDSEPRIGVLLCNLGSPAEPTAAAVRPYLRQFLSDPRVVEIPPLLWQPILRGIILNTRPAKSAAKYATIWTSEGAPLAVHTRKQASLLNGYLGHAGHQGISVDYAMRYGEPSIPAVLERLKAQGCSRILVLPLYPQYAASAGASVMDEVARAMLAMRNLPELRFVRNFHDDPGYIAALAASVREHRMRNGANDVLVMSFHGTPRRSLDLGDPYFCECQKTARLLAEALELPKDAWRVCFQSRFGKAEWLQPYTTATLHELARAGRSVDVMCPGFVSDCLETLEEIAVEGKADYLAAGGPAFGYIPCLNERPDWIEALSRLTQAHLGDWLQRPRPDRAALETTRLRARELGAAR